MNIFVLLKYKTLKALKYELNNVLVNKRHLIKKKFIREHAAYRISCHKDTPHFLY